MNFCLDDDHLTSEGEALRHEEECARHSKASHERKNQDSER